MFTPRDYPYKCCFLGHLLLHEKIIDRQVLLDRVQEMDTWLAANLTRAGVEEWYLSDKKDKKIGMYWVHDKPGKVFHYNHPKAHYQIRISRYVFFKNETDLLAFKMRFGIFKEYSMRNIYSI